ncbi:hypothetical protein D9Q98_006959 [Chlorella vulgaris]|uniref:Uncharacterized protein n=1 Tax=Chlorella vulgaris TaxID=3077 RepID=A0A9D4TJ87_CHLVU|nr:hypothetical protein D9Q98_006959 [Chlorella vulgaris]
MSVRNASEFESGRERGESDIAAPASPVSDFAPSPASNPAASPLSDFAFTPPAAAPPAAARPTSAGSQPSSPRRGSLSLTASDSRLLKGANRRQLAAEWLTSLTGAAVPYDSDAAFRASLRDGVTLCRLINELRPGSVSKIMDFSQECSSPTGEVIQSFENVANFIKACRGLIGDDAALCASDLEDMSLGERPGVADCCLALHAWWLGQQAGGASLRGSASFRASFGSASSGATPPAATPTHTPAPAGLRSSPTLSPAGLPQPPSPRGGSPSRVEFSFTPHATSAVNHATTQRCNDGLEFLMRTCNHMLKSSMGVPISSPLPQPPSNAGGMPSEIAIHAVGPVLESVLQTLTEEYEKRLLRKDSEFKLSCEAQERMQADILRLRQEVARWKEAAAAVKYLPAPESEDSNSQRLAQQQELAAKEAAAAAEVARKEAELQAVQQEAASKVADAEAQLNELAEEVQQYRHLNERYHVVTEENRQLYNTVQDLRGSIRVFCRVRPRGATGDGSANMVELDDEGALNVFSQKHNKWHNYKFDRAFGEDSTQNDVYAETQPLIRSVLDGYNVCIFAYGQTGSGKTHTMSGTDIGEYANRGINYRALDDLFQLNRERHAEVEYNIKVQLLEIYNESIRDLLVPDIKARQQGSLQLVNTQRSGSNVPEATQVPVSCTEDVLEVMERGQRNRAVAETKMNSRSSRSHQVLTVMVEGSSKITHARTHGCLHLVDLAGSERVGKSGAEGQQLLEAQNINRSLSALGTVMHALASKSAHVPFRDSKLTQLLQDSLSGQAKTMMFMHVAPEMSSVSETLSTLNFGRNVTEITLGAAKKNSESGSAWEAKERAMKSEREAAAARNALAAEQQRSAALQSELESLRAQLSRAAGSPYASSEDEGSIRAYPPSATRQPAAPVGNSTGERLTSRSRLSLTAAAAAGGGNASGGRVTPRSGGGGAAAPGSRGLTPRGGAAGDGGSITPRGVLASARPAQVSRLNLGSGGKAAASGNPGLRPPMAKLNLSKLNLQHSSEAEENRAPLSARQSLGGGAASGGTTPRGGTITTPRGSTSWLTDGEDSEAGSPGCVGPAAAAAAGQAQAPGQEALESFDLIVSPPRPLTSRSSARHNAVLGRGGAAGTAGPRQQPQQLPKLALPQGRASAPSSRIPVPSPPSSAAATAAARLRQPSGSLTARPSLRASPSLSGSSSLRAPMSARESPAEAASRRAALQKAASASGASGLHRSVAESGIRRAASGASELSSSGSLNSARGGGVRSSLIGTGRRWN